MCIRDRTIIQLPKPPRNLLDLLAGRYKNFHAIQIPKVGFRKADHDEDQGSNVRASTVIIRMPSAQKIPDNVTDDDEQEISIHVLIKQQPWVGTKSII